MYTVTANPVNEHAAVDDTAGATNPEESNWNEAATQYLVVVEVEVEVVDVEVVVDVGVGAAVVDVVVVVLVVVVLVVEVVLVVDVVVVVHGDGILLGQAGYPTTHPAPISIQTFAYVGVTNESKLGHSIYPAGQFAVVYDVPCGPFAPG